MTDPTTPTPKRRSPKRSPSFAWTLLVLIFRLLLLGISVSLATLVGIAIAALFPGDVPEPPLLERLIRANPLSDRPDPVQSPVQSSSQPTPPAIDTPRPEPTLPAPESSIPSEAQPSPEPIALSDSEREQIQAELDALQAEYQALNDRIAALETDLGSPVLEEQPATEPLAERLAALEQRLDPTAVAPDAPVETPTEIPTETPTAIVAPDLSPDLAIDTATRSDTLQVTLPTDALFEASQNRLNPGTYAVLDSIITDLSRYPNATIQVAAHTNTQSSPAQNRVQSFEQAKTIQQYLANALGSGVHWVVVGYGQSRPIASSVNDQSRNRRLEITID